MAENKDIAAEEKIPQEAEQEVKKETKTTENEQYVPGRYKAIKAIKVMKQISFANKKNSDGTIARTFATWTAPNNFYYFSTDVSTELNKEDLKHPTIRQLIDNGTIFRVLK